MWWSVTTGWGLEEFPSHSSPCWGPKDKKNDKWYCCHSFYIFPLSIFFKSYKKGIQGTTGEKLTNIDKHLPNSHGLDTALAIQDKSRWGRLLDTRGVDSLKKHWMHGLWVIQFWPSILENCGKVVQWFHDTEEMGGWYLMFSINLSGDFISFYWIPIQHRVKKEPNASGTPTSQCCLPKFHTYGHQWARPEVVSWKSLLWSPPRLYNFHFPDFISKEGANEARMRKHLSSFHFPVVSDPYTVHKSWLCLSRSLTVVNTPSKK